MSGNNPIYDNLIIGGGISGLGLGHLCARKGLRTLLLEREEQVGGCIRSHTFWEAGGFWVELGSHTCYNSYGHLLDMISDLGLEDDLQFHEFAQALDPIEMHPCGTDQVKRPAFADHAPHSQGRRQRRPGHRGSRRSARPAYTRNDRGCCHQPWDRRPGCRRTRPDVRRGPSSGRRHGSSRAPWLRLD